MEKKSLFFILLFLDFLYCGDDSLILKSKIIYFTMNINSRNSWFHSYPDEMEQLYEIVHDPKIKVLYDEINILEPINITMCCFTGK